MIMRKILILISSIAMVLSCTKAPDVNLGIVPKPMSMEVKEYGAFDISKGFVICTASEELSRPAEIFACQVEQMTCYLPAVQKGRNKCGAINLSIDSLLEAEEYHLRVTSSRILVVGGSARGVFHGMQSLRQLISECLEIGAIPAMDIKDRPFFEYRGMMLDVCRHFSSVDDVKRYIDILSMHKVNTFHWHLTDDQGWRIHIEKYPELTKIGAVRKETVVGHASRSKIYDGIPYGEGLYYTYDQIRDVVKYASERFIEVIPEIEMPGHTLAVLAAYPELGCIGKGYDVASTWGVFEDVVCPGKEEVFTFFENVLDEVLELFPSSYIHIGGDECPKVRWEKCPLCQKRIQEEKLQDEKELQSYFMKRIERYVNSKGKSVIGWEELLEGGASPTATVMCWKHPEVGVEAAHKGNKVIMVNSQYSYFDYYQSEDTENEPFAIGGLVPASKVYSYNPYNRLDGDSRNSVIGVQANLWSEYIKDMKGIEYMVLPRMAAMAENGWAYDRKNYEDFLSRLHGLRNIYDCNDYNYAKHIFNY